MTSRPNILIVMVDQLTGTLFEDGPAEFLHAPNLRRLADNSVRFANAYTASPLCAPARAAFMSGALPRRTRVYDNAAEFASDIPTYAHHLRRAGYYTALSGKMHFVGPDQTHGFEERLTTDIYPADFGWTPDYRKPGERIDWWYHNMGSVTGAGVAEITNQLEYDDDVCHQAVQKIYDLSRGLDPRPWCLTASFTHPHDPFVARRKYWDLYNDAPELEPPTPVAYEDMDAHSKRLMDACDWRELPITEDDVHRARHGYFANISYIDDKIGEILAVLEARCGLSFSSAEVYLNVAGGYRLADPAADLAVAAALISALADKPLPADATWFGEVSLSGEIRPVSHAGLRVKEAAKLGFDSACGPTGEGQGVAKLRYAGISALPGLVDRVMASS